MITNLEPTLPTATGACPMLTGLSGATVTINDSSGPDAGHTLELDGGDASEPDGGHASEPDGGAAPGPDGGSVSGSDGGDGGDAGDGQTVFVWSGQSQPGAGAPILFYWHGTGSTPQEVQALMGTQISEITSQGGLVAAFASTTGTGANTSGTAVFYSDDFKTADQIVACAVQQLHIDVHRIYAAGCDSGGLQAGAMLYYRSSYLAAAMPNSGGIGLPTQLENPHHVPALITAHGAAASDVVVLDFSQTSLDECADVKSKGGFAVDCNHGGGHCGAPADLIAAQWQFCKDHPFGVAIEPYKGGLPTSFPSYCVIQ